MEMTRQEFSKSAHALLKAIRETKGNNDKALNQLLNWQLERKSDDEQGTISCVYLSHPPVAMYLSADSAIVPKEDQQGFCLEDESILVDSQQFCNDSQDVKPTQWAFSIIYSETYRVPVLYFRVQETNGTPCTRQRVLNWLYPTTQDLVEDTWEFVSQEEHPFSGLPSFFLHPCQTAQRLWLVRSDDGENNTDDCSILWTWMSMILPVVNYPIPPKLFLEIQTNHCSTR